MKLLLIRHGETNYNVAQRVQGHDEIPINDRGIAQIAALGQRLAGETIHHMYSSDIRRAAQSAVILAAHTGVPLTYEPLFRERHPGELIHQTYDEANAFFFDRDYAPPGGESYPEFEARVAQAFQQLAEKESGNGRTIAVVSHGMFCRAFLRCLLDIPNEQQPERWPNGSLTIAEYDAGWRLVSAADAAHLESI